MNGKPDVCGCESYPHTCHSPLLEEREATHGDFAAKARFIQSFKTMMRAQDGYADLLPHQREALDLIATKIGRILHGAPEFADHWDDIAGYALLGARQ